MNVIKNSMLIEISGGFLEAPSPFPTPTADPIPVPEKPCPPIICPPDMLWAVM
jgi:hypothetical protein